jgi:energy-coupling factor transporter ATP-binding protein EcfA2
MTMHIHTTGMKARDLDLDLPGPCVLLVGCTGSGKSTILDAIRIAALRHVPALGKTEAATAQLMSGRELSVTLALPGKRVIRQKLTKGARGNLSWATECSWLGPEAKDTEHAAEALRLFGEDATAVAECLDLRSLLALSGPQRTARIEQLMATETDPDAQALRLARYAFQRLADVDDQRMKDVADHTTLRPLINGWDKDGAHAGQYASLAEVWPMVKAKLTAEGGLTSAAAWVNEEKRAGALDLAKKERARDELALRLQEIADPDADEIARLEETRAALDQHIGAAGERASEAMRRRNEIGKADAALSRAKAEAATALTARQRYEQDAAAAGDWKARLEEIEAELEAIVTGATPDPGASVEAERRAQIEERLSALAEEIATAEGAIPAEPISTDALAAEIASLMRQLQAARANPWAEVRMLAADIREQASRIPKAKEISKKADRLVEIAGANVDDPAALTAAIEAKEAEKARAEKEASGIREKRRYAQEALAKLLGERDELRLEAHQVKEQIDAAKRQADSATFDRRTKLTVERTDLRHKLEMLSRRDRETEKAAVTTGEALRSAEALRLQLGDAPEDVAGVDEALTAERDEVAGRLSRMLDARAQHRQLADVIAEINRLGARHAVLLAIEDACKRLRADEVAAQGGPLLEILTTYLRAAGRTETPYIVANRTSCDFGWVRGDKQVSIAAMSGGEWGLFAAGLTAALLILRAAPVRILLVESAELDTPTLQQMLRGIAALKSELTACLAAAWHGESVKVDGWTVLRASGERIAEAA